MTPIEKMIARADAVEDGEVEEPAEASAELDADAEASPDGAPEVAEADSEPLREVGPQPESAVEESHVRMVEALLFAAAEPLDEATIASRIPEEFDIPSAMAALSEIYEGRGVTLIKVAGRWTFRTAPDLAFLLEKEQVEPKKLSRAALETLAIIAYHQPVTRAEIEEIRGVMVSKGTLDFLLEIGWIRLRGRRRAPGRPVAYGTSEAFLEHFGLDAVGDLPGMEELKAAGLLDARLPPGFQVPSPADAQSAEDDDLDPVEDDVEFTQDFFDEDVAEEAEAAS